MTIVPPNGPVPCDLVVVGEAPGSAELAAGQGFVGPSGKILWDESGSGLNLIGSLLDRPRSTVYVTNVTKCECPDEVWQRMSSAAQQKHIKELRAELAKVDPKVVLAFGRRASSALIPGFKAMTTDSGHPRRVAEGWNVMPLWHPAAYLRGNKAALQAIIDGLLRVPALLAEAPREPPDKWLLDWEINGVIPKFTTTTELLDEWPSAEWLLTKKSKNAAPALNFKRKARCRTCHATPYKCAKATDEDGGAYHICNKCAWRHHEWIARGRPSGDVIGVEWIGGELLPKGGLPWDEYHNLLGEPIRGDMRF